MEVVEIKSSIQKYLNIDYKNRRIKEILDVVRYEFYAYHSFIGVAMTGNNPMDYQKAINPQQAVLKLVGHENLLKRRYEKNRKRQKLILEFLTVNELRELSIMQQFSHVTSLEMKAYEAIEEIEFYIEQHINAKIEKILGVPYRNEVAEKMVVVDEMESNLMERLKMFA